MEGPIENKAGYIQTFTHSTNTYLPYARHYSNGGYLSVKTDETFAFKDLII